MGLRLKSFMALGRGIQYRGEAALGWGIPVLLTKFIVVRKYLLSCVQALLFDSMFNRFYAYFFS